MQNFVINPNKHVYNEKNIQIQKFLSIILIDKSIHSGTQFNPEFYYIQCIIIHKS